MASNGCGPRSRRCTYDQQDGLHSAACTKIPKSQLTSLTHPGIFREVFVGVFVVVGVQPLLGGLHLGVRCKELGQLRIQFWKLSTKSVNPARMY